jgi:hypothetical protein
MKKIAFILLLGIIVSSCKKETADLDKEVIVEIPLILSTGTFAPDFKTLPASTYLVDFDKRDYPKVDSITFNVTMATGPQTDTAYVRLFNITDNVEIANSTLSMFGNNIEGKQVRTNNLYQSLPDKRITLAIQTKGGAGVIYNAFLKLRRQ